MNSQPDPKKGQLSALAAVSIPFILLLAPAVGGYFGHLADQHLGTAPWGIAVGVIFGLFGAYIRTRNLLRQMSGNGPDKRTL